MLIYLVIKFDLVITGSGSNPQSTELDWYIYMFVGEFGF